MMPRFFVKHKKHFICISILTILVLLNLHHFLNINELPTVDHSTTYLARSFILKKSITEFSDFIPLWNPYLMAGTPFLAYVNNLGILSITGILTLIFSSSVHAIHINFLLNVIFSSITMYFFVFYLTKNHKAAVFSGIVYSFSGPIMRLFTTGSLTQLNGFPLVPLIFLFLFKTFREKDWVKNSVITGLLLALIVRFDPDLKIVLYALLLWGIFLLFQVLFKPTKSTVKKVLIAALIMGLICFGLSAQRILPGKEYIDTTSRAKLSYEESASRKTQFGDLFTTVVEPLDEQFMKIRFKQGSYEMRSKFSGIFKMGIIAFFFACFALIRKFKHKDVILFGTGSIFFLALTTGSFVFYLLWRFIPPFDSFRYLERIYSLFGFTFSVLAGLGFYFFLRMLNKKKIRSKTKKLISFGVLALLCINLGVFNTEPVPVSITSDIHKLLDSNELMKYLDSQEGIFRTHIYETRGIDWTTEYIYVPYNQEGLYGEEGTWLVEYMNIFMGAARYDPPKIWGLMNTKYVTSTNPLNISGLNLIKEFRGCTENCPETKDHYKAYGPYLYENRKAMPRAYLVENSVLVVGEKDAVTQTIYALILNSNFNPENTVIIRGNEKISSYSGSELKKYNAIFLAKGANDRNSETIIREYVNSGGLLLPDITNNVFSVTEQEIAVLLEGFSGNLIGVPDKNVIMHNFDKREVILEGTLSGFLVLSEKFSVLPGWKSYSPDSKKEILNANVMNTAVHVNGDDRVFFEYQPKSYVVGSAITYLTLLLVLAFFIVWFYRKRKNGQ